MKTTFLIIVGAALFFTPIFSLEAAGLVPCGGPDPEKPCTTCDFFILAQNILDLVLRKIVPALAVIFVIYGGFVLLTAGGSEERVKSGRKILFNAVIGLAIAYGAFVIVGSVLGALSPRAGGFFNFDRGRIIIDCKVPPPPEIVRDRDRCTDFNLLASHYGTSRTLKESPALQTLKSCVQNELTKAGKWALVDASQIYTWERAEISCNYTRGDNICTNSGSCAHTYYSCHYGGENGKDGAEAVDYNTKDPSRVSEEQLFKELEKLSGKCNFSLIAFENDHTHINTKTCDRQRGGE